MGIEGKSECFFPGLLRVGRGYSFCLCGGLRMMPGEYELEHL